MKYPKISEKNKQKECPFCDEVVTIEMVGLDGFCPFCEEKLYTLDTRGGKR